MSSPQPAILAPLPPHGVFLTLALAPAIDARRVLERLSRFSLGDRDVLAIGAPLVRALGADLAALRPFPALAGAGVAIPSTQGAIYFHAGADDPGAALLRGRALVAALEGSVRVQDDVIGFTYDAGRDLSGYEDGTENPKGDRAREVAIVAGAGEGLDGGSFVAAQRWVHDLSRLDALAPAARDRLIGRSRASNEELADAPASAHVKRAAQESFEPPAFMLRRSMPYGGVGEHGLFFVAYGATFDPFERALRRMVGLEDGVVDGLFGFSRPVTGGYYWCPPRGARGALDLRALGA